MANIMALIESGADINVTVSLLDLKEFVLEMCEQVNNKRNAQQPDEELTQKEAAELLQVSTNCLWRWNRDGYLVAHKIGKRAFYYKSQIDALKKGGKA